MADRIDVFQEQFGGYFIAWEDEGTPGAALGEEEDEEHQAATAAAIAIVAPTRHDSLGRALWESESDARKAMRGARAGLRAWKAEQKAKAAGKPLPDWAKTAIAAGFKPPKGWTP